MPLVRVCAAGMGSVWSWRTWRAPQASYYRLDMLKTGRFLVGLGKIRFSQRALLKVKGVLYAAGTEQLYSRLSRRGSILGTCVCIVISHIRVYKNLLLRYGCDVCVPISILYVPQAFGRLCPHCTQRYTPFGSC